MVYELISVSYWIVHQSRRTFSHLELRTIGHERNIEEEAQLNRFNGCVAPDRTNRKCLLNVPPFQEVQYVASLRENT